MSDRISLQKLRDNEGEVPYDETVAALVEAVEAASELVERLRSPGKREFPSLEAKLARFDFGDDHAV